ncbi:hypothetical protein SAMN02745166_04354 [Prosthecobacter debontii]|uniref:Uncharacterized protein n=2 Tax=Prosthecobacter debontii TaxID=48467 RepID=A0A1T4YWB0_9BACT|nr:hypothetical protein SAMN02745166_04354 [Prosthecobacter debontii]
MVMALTSEIQVLGASVLTAALGYGLAWWLQQKKIGALVFKHELERGEFQSVLEAQKAELSQQEIAARKALEAAGAEKAVVEERFALFRDAAQRREADAYRRISDLEADLTSVREVAAQLAPTQARIGDLEVALTAERGRLSAVEQTLTVTQNRAQDLEQQLHKTQQALATHQEKASAREADLVSQLAEREQSLAADQARLGTVDEEIAQLKEKHTSYQTTAESRIAGLQRQLAAAEAKAAMVQKEFMSAVGVLPEPSESNAAASTDKRILELEAKINHIEAEARKKAREDGYKIAELEYRLSEAQEAATSAQGTGNQAAEVETLLTEVKSLLAEKESLMNDLETLKTLKAKAVEPVPEVLEQGLLQIGDAPKEE